MQTILEEYLKTPVVFNRIFQVVVNNDEDNTGTACWDLSETMIFLFADKTKMEESDTPNTITSYYLDVCPQEHFVIKLGNVVYEMVDGKLYINKYVSDEILFKNSLELLKKFGATRVVKCEKTYYTLLPLEKMKENYNKLLEESHYAH